MFFGDLVCVHVCLRQPINSAFGERMRRHSDFQAVLVMRSGTERQSLGEALMHFKGDGGDVLLLVSLPPVLSVSPLMVPCQCLSPSLLDSCNCSYV